MRGEKQMAELLWDRPQAPQRGSGCTYTGASQGRLRGGPLSPGPRNCERELQKSVSGCLTL